MDVLAGTVDGDTGGSYEFGPGPIGFLVLAAIALAIVFLYRSMRKNLRRIDFDADGRDDAERMSDGDAGDRR